MDDDDYLDIDLNFPILDEQVAELIEEKFNCVGNLWESNSHKSISDRSFTPDSFEA